MVTIDWTSRGGSSSELTSYVNNDVGLLKWGIGTGLPLVLEGRGKRGVKGNFGIGFWGVPPSKLQEGQRSKPTGYLIL